MAPRRDGVTAVERNCRRDIETHLGVPADAVRVIPVGIDPDVFAPPPAGRPRDADSIVVTTSADVPLKGLVHLLDRKSTRLNSSHANISYAVFCLKKKKTSHLHYTLRRYVPYAT